MVINTNISAQSSAQLLGQSSSMLAKSLARLSSGSKIVSPSDDSAGLAVSMKLNAQISRTNAAQSNVGNATSFNQTQDGYLSKVNDALNRMSELSVLAQDVTKTTSDRSLYNQEFSTLSTNVGVDLGNTTYTTATGSTIDTVAHASTALTNVKAAINQLASDRANIGSNIESLGYYNDQLGSLSNNLSA